MESSQTLGKTAIEILDETVEFYGADPMGRRSVDPEMNKCMYFGPDGNRCAASRCFDEEMTADMQNPIEGRKILDLLNKYGDEIFRPEYRGHSVSFWQEVQKLHDSRMNWDFENGGLSDIGKINVRAIRHSLSEFQLKIF